jgi:hypothetical protein
MASQGGRKHLCYGDLVQLQFRVVPPNVDPPPLHDDHATKKDSLAAYLYSEGSVDPRCHAEVVHHEVPPARLRV